jgi:hypothetical protein
MFQFGKQAAMRFRLLIFTVCAACRLGEHIAEPPIDGVPGVIDAPGEDVDAPIDAPPGFMGMRATIGERPEVTGRFDPPLQMQDVSAGWDFDTDADSYADPSYNFMPPWPSAQSGRFSVRFTGKMSMIAGTHCLSIDIGATGTGIIDGRNGCGQIWLGAATTASAETGFEAATAGPATGCIDLPADGQIDLAIVFWYFNILERAKLVIRHCMGAGCTPNEPLSATWLTP